MLFAKYKQRKAELEKERLLLKDSIKEAMRLGKENKDLLKTVDSYKKQGALLLLEDLDEDLIKKLQSLTEDNIIIIFCKDGTRLEIKANETNYKRNTGVIR